MKCQCNWPEEEPATVSERHSRGAVRWGMKWSMTSMLVARRKRWNYADNNHGEGTTEFDQMTE
jgi:hypothetical protein